MKMMGEWVKRDKNENNDKKSSGKR